MMSQMSSKISYIGFCLLWMQHPLGQQRLPPRQTMPISRLRTNGRCSRSTPAWIVK